MADSVIKSFLVGLGFKIDDNSQQKFDAAITGATAKGVALGEAMYETAKQVGEAIISMARDFDQLYWQTERLNSSAGDIKAFGYAMSQLGGSAQGAQAMLENLAEFAKSSPGAQGFLRRLGVAPEDMGNAVAMAKDLEKTFSAMPYYRAKVFGQVLGIDPIQLQAMLRDQGQYEDQYKQFAQKLGIDLDDVSGKANDFTTKLREMKAEAGLAFDVALYKGLEWLLPKLEAVSRWVQDILSGKKLSGVGGEFQKIVTDVMALLHALGELAGTPYMQNFADKMLSALDHVIRGFTSLIKLVTDVLNGNWRAAYADAKSIVWQGSGMLDNIADAVMGRGSDRYRQTNAFDGASNDNQRSGPGGYFGGASAGGGGGGRGGSRADRNNNPGNITDGSFARSQPGYAGSDGRFAIFASPEAGRAAQEKLLSNYIVRGRNTIASIIAKYAPASENNVAAYVGHIERLLGIGRNVRLNLGDVHRLAGAMAIHEGYHGLGVSRGRGGVAIHQKTDIHVHGHDSKQIAHDVAGHQVAVNERLTSNAATYAY